MLLDEIRDVDVSLSPMFFGENPPQLRPNGCSTSTTGGPFYCLSFVVVFRFTLHAGTRKTYEVRLVPVVRGSRLRTQRVALKGNTRAWVVGWGNTPTLDPLPISDGRLVGTSTHGPALKGSSSQRGPLDVAATLRLSQRFPCKPAKGILKRKRRRPLCL